MIFLRTMNVHIAKKNSGSEYNNMVELYTLPGCGICHIIKTKLEQKGIQFEEKGLDEISEILHVDHAPILHVIHNDGEEYVMSPSKINEWISKQ